LGLLCMKNQKVKAVERGKDWLMAGRIFNRGLAPPVHVRDDQATRGQARIICNYLKKMVANGEKRYVK